MFVSSSDTYHVHNVWHIINDHRSSCLCLLYLNIVSLMFDILSMIINVYVCVFQSYIPCPHCLTYHQWSSFFICLFLPELIKLPVLIIQNFHLWYALYIYFFQGWISFTPQWHSESLLVASEANHALQIWLFFPKLNRTARGVPPPPSTSSLQLLCQHFARQCWDRTGNSETDWWDLHMQILLHLGQWVGVCVFQS